MSSPQKEHGYTAIANEILEALAKIRIPGEARQMLDVIIRKTYGFNKKSDQISTKQFIRLTELSRPSIQKNRKRLSDMNLIAISQEGYTPKTYSFNKDFETWVGVSKKVYCIPKGNKVYTNRVQNCIPKSIHSSIYKVRQKTERQKDTVKFPFDEIWKRYPKPFGKKMALKHFNKSVKTEQDWQDINKALDHYLQDIKNKGTEEQYIQYGSAWFNNWTDWVNVKTPSTKF